ncbi:pyridoxamine 5'-phosphate oxidase family protein [Paenibacillus sp. NPDC058071]|uniref:pyridoxamine 5'-phosphate oxidase family protein n=1 Tax=Paenibacillus sp. NPDC058071 TaxID=3346326 RepID=UPI0036DD8C75
MKKNVYEVDQSELDLFLSEMSFGFLGMTEADGRPAVTPLNYVYWNGRIYFHGSRAGEKMSRMSADARVSFCVAKEYAIIPSYFTDPIRACPASSYFKSAVIDGHAVLVDDLAEKAAVLQVLMEKLQPEGGYKPISAEDPVYRGSVKGVAVVRIDPARVSCKFKFGQNHTDEENEPIIEGLSKRGEGLDEETAALMRKYCPHASSRQDPNDTE